MKKNSILFSAVLLCMQANGHPLPRIETENLPLSTSQILVNYIKLGFTHVLPFGADHILFILGIFFLNSNFRSVLIQCTVFTLAHSISLGFAAAGLFIPDAEIIEPMIAFTIIFVALENLYMNKVNIRRLIMIFFFGIIHGLGFASALNATELQSSYFFLSLFSFNLGVEFGQIVILTLAYFTIAINFREYIWYKKYVTNPISIMIGLTGLYWFVIRMIN